MPDYNMLFQAPNAGAAFNQGMQQGQQHRQQQMQQQYMMQRQQQEDQRRSQQDHMQALEAHRENIVKGAQIIRQINPKDDASWQQAKALAAQAGVDVSEVPDHFDPQYVQGISAIADAFNPQKPDNPSSVREFEYAKQQGFGGSYTDFIQMVHPPSPVTIPANATVSAPGQQPNVPKVSDEASYNAIPPGTKYMAPDGHIRIKGGATGSAPSANFP